MNKLTQLLIVAFLIRAVLAPFFVHPWDMTTIQSSLNLFFQGENPYEHFSQISNNLQTSTGLPFFFEGYAYLPHLLYAYSPFYAVYLSTGADPEPIKNVFQGSPVDFSFSPDSFMFMFLMKLPLILADTLAVYMLYNFKSRLGYLYAFSPYIIFVSAIWGMFDALTAVLLLLSVLSFLRNNKFLSGIFFGLSLIKPIPIVALPVFLAVMLRNRDFKGTMKFVAGGLVSQIPTLYYFLANQGAFVKNFFEFQMARIAGGITPTNILWNIPDFLFTFAVSNYISIIFAASYIIMLAFVIKKKISLEYGVVITILLYMMMGKVVNEQYLLMIYPLLLLKLKDFTRSLDKYLIAFAMVRSTPIYFALPIIALFGPYYNQIVGGWYSFLAINLVDYARFFSMYLIGTLFFLEVAGFIWLNYRSHVRSKDETVKIPPPKIVS